MSVTSLFLEMKDKTVLIVGAGSVGIRRARRFLDAKAQVNIVTRSIDEDIILKLDDIAASVSLRTETVSRKLREMEKKGLIERLGHARIRVLDRDALRDLYVSQ